MIKSKLFILAFYGLLASVHFCIAQLFPKSWYTKDLVLVYTALIIITFIGSTLLHFSFKSQNESAFASMFMVFTTIQMLGVMSLAAFFIYGGFENPKPTVLQLLILFFLSLIFQTIYFIRLGKKNKPV